MKMKMKVKRRTNQTREVKIERKRGKRAQRRIDDSQPAYEEMKPVTQKRVSEPISAMTEAQGHYLCSILNNTITFGIGPAGTGKSYVAVGLACDMLMKGEIDKIVITRPAVDAGESFGFLPGEIEEKYAVYLDPFRDIFHERLGKSQTEYMIKHGKIQAKPLAFMRGTTFNDSWVILDESQNTTPAQMKMFLTRIGKNCTVIVDGDVAQKDISSQSGLSDAVSRLRKVDNVSVIEFGTDDIVRSGIVRDIIAAYTE